MVLNVIWHYNVKLVHITFIKPNGKVTLDTNADNHVWQYGNLDCNNIGMVYTTEKDRKM